jgi:hypothetical protein
VVNAHILHSTSSKKKMSLEMFYEKVAKGLIASAGTNIQEQGQTSSPAGRLVGTDHFLYRIPTTHAEPEDNPSGRVGSVEKKASTRLGKL